MQLADRNLWHRLGKHQLPWAARHVRIGDVALDCMATALKHAKLHASLAF